MCSNVVFQTASTKTHKADAVACFQEPDNANLPSYRPFVALDKTLYISLDMPPDLDTKPTDPGLYSLQATMFSRVPAVSPILKAPAYNEL